MLKKPWVEGKEDEMFEDEEAWVEGYESVEKSIIREKTKGGRYRGLLADAEGDVNWAVKLRDADMCMYCRHRISSGTCTVRMTYLLEKGSGYPVNIAARAAKVDPYRICPKYESR